MNDSKCVPSVLVPCKMYPFQKDKHVRIIKIKPGGAGAAILGNYEKMFASPELYLSEGDFSYKVFQSRMIVLFAKFLVRFKISFVGTDYNCLSYLCLDNFEQIIMNTFILSQGWVSRGSKQWT